MAATIRVEDSRTAPIHLDDDLTATSGLGSYNGARLLGFGPRGAQRVTVWSDTALDDPSAVVGLVPTFVSTFDGGLFEWDTLVSEFVVSE